MPFFVLFIQFLTLSQVRDDVYLINPETYVLHPRDRLQLVISGAQGFVQDLVVNGDGTMIVTVGSPGTIAEPSELPVPGETSMLTADFATGMPLGVVYADGKTLKEVETEVRQIVRKYYTGVEVRLVIVRPRHFIILPTGAVQDNLPLEVAPLMRVSNIIGSIRFKPTASLMNIELRFLDGSVDTADYIRYILTGDIKYDPPFREEGVVLYFPEMKNSVALFGAVQRHGTANIFEVIDTLETFQSVSAVHEIYDGENLRELIQITGGFLHNADVSNITIKRNGTVFRIDGKDNSAMENFVLENGDTILVPEIRNSVIVLGGVKNPGEYAFVPMKTAFEYVSIAGGVTDRGMLNRISVFTYGGVRRGEGINTPVERGDVVKVPEVTFKWWQDYTTAIGAALVSLASLIILLSR